jgi:hypothetical protein
MELSYDQQETLESRARARRAARSVERVRIVLLAGAGRQDQQIATKLKITLRRPHAVGIGFWTAVLRRWTKMRHVREERQRLRRRRCKR